MCVGQNGPCMPMSQSASCCFPLTCQPTQATPLGTPSPDGGMMPPDGGIMPGGVCL
jgi:hypothetical protein